MFVSEEIGFFKPDSRYFEACFSQISGFDRLKAVMVGDSLSSDITGGINAGIETVWLNRFGEENESAIQPDYEISDISELKIFEKYSGTLPLYFFIFPGKNISGELNERI